MTTFSDDVASLARDLLCSLWAELGVEGSPGHHQGQAIDLEPLIVLTALAADPQLRGRSLAWCAANSRYLSMVRLRRFSRALGDDAAHAFKRYAASLDKGARRTRLSASPDLRRPSLIQLRLRALLGVTARAEALRLLMAHPDESRTAASLARAAGYGKEGLERALEMLASAGLTTVTSDGRGTAYRLKRPSDLAHALSGLPARFPDWAATFAVVATILDYAAQSAGKAATRVELAAAAVDRIREEIARIPGASRPARVTDDPSAAAFERWARSFVAAQAGAEAPEPGKREVTYTVHRLLLGGWIATVKEEGDQPRPLALSDGPELHPERRARRRLNLDELGAAAEVVGSMLYDLRSRALQRRHGSLVPRDAVADSLLPAVSRAFAAEFLRPMHKGKATTFTDEFLERWSSNRLGRLSAG